MVAVEADGDESADPLLVSPVEVVFVQVEVRPVVTECDLQGIDALEDAVAGAAYDGLHGNGVIARADAVAVVGADVFVADGVLARVVRVGIAERKIDRRAPVFPRDEEFFFLFRIESGAVDVVDAVADFEQKAHLHDVFLERVGEDGGEADFCLELAVTEDGEVGGVFAQDEHRDE